MISSESRNPVLRLLNCIRHLGLRTGFRYWRLQNKSIRDPHMALRWALRCREEALRLDHLDKGNEAAVFRRFANELEDRNRKYHGNFPRTTTQTTK